MTVFLIIALIIMVMALWAIGGALRNRTTTRR